MKKIIISAIFSIIFQPVLACTIFILTDGHKSLFFNNEDFTNPNNRIWFIPGGANYYGCVFVGYDDGSAQGGLNTEGLAFDWYAGMSESYTPESHLIPIEDNSSERMLEQCATVEEAIKFYQTYAESGFAKASIIIADESGASVIIGARDGKLFFDKSTEPNVLGGQGKKIFEHLYTKNTPITLDSGREILKQCLATGPGGTLYSNSYNLKTGDIHIYNFSKQDKDITLNLDYELEKGEHYYDIKRISDELNEPIKPLPLNMQRLILFEFQPLKNQEPKISSLAERVFTEGAKGNLKEEIFSVDFWNELRNIQEDIKSELQTLGRLKSCHLIQKEATDEFAYYRYVMVFENARLLQEFKLNENEKISDLQTLSAFVMNFEPEEIENGKLKDPSRFTDYALFILGLIILGLLIIIAVKRRQRNPI